jgi:dipeptidyl aminopeptidase/acylaminoacyl peptidase
MTTSFPATRLAPLTKPMPLIRLGLALALLALALMAAALLALGPTPSPTLSLRNGLIAFDAGSDIWVANGDGTGLRRVTETEAAETSPMWSPDGSRLAVLRNTDGVPAFAILRPDGTTEQVIDAPDGYTIPSARTECNSFASWSPDGRMLAAKASAAGASGTRSSCSTRAMVRVRRWT